MAKTVKTKEKIEINPSIFKAYDIRGIYPNDINEDVVVEIANVLKKKIFKKGVFVIAHDARISSPSIYKKVCNAIGDEKTIKAGYSTSPMFYYTVANNNATGGIMITASHNPKEWNGMKAVRAKAVPISGVEIKIIMNN